MKKKDPSGISLAATQAVAVNGLGKGVGDAVAILVGLAMIFDLVAWVHMTHYVPIASNLIWGLMSPWEFLLVGVLASIARHVLAGSDPYDVFNTLLSIILSVVLTISVLVLGLIMWDGMSLSLWVLIANYGQWKWPSSRQQWPMILWLLHAVMQWAGLRQNGMTPPATDPVLIFLLATGLGAVIWFYLTQSPNEVSG